MVAYILDHIRGSSKVNPALDVRLSNDRWVVFELLQKTTNSEIELVQRKIPSEANALERSHSCQPSFIDEVLRL